MIRATIRRAGWRHPPPEDLKGSAVTPMPAIVVNLRSFPVGCDCPVRCAAEVADTVLQQATACTAASAGPTLR